MSHSLIVAGKKRKENQRLILSTKGEKNEFIIEDYKSFLLWWIKALLTLIWNAYLITFSSEKLKCQKISYYMEKWNNFYILGTKMIKKKDIYIYIYIFFFQTMKTNLFFKNIDVFSWGFGLFEVSVKIWHDLLLVLHVWYYVYLRLCCCKSLITIHFHMYSICIA